jgi:hypothetical protein
MRWCGRGPNIFDFVRHSKPHPLEENIGSPGIVVIFGSLDRKNRVLDDGSLFQPMEEFSQSWRDGATSHAPSDINLDSFHSGVFAGNDADFPHHVR